MNLFDKPLFTFEMANNHQGSVEHGKRIIREIKQVILPFEEYFDFAVKFQYRDLDTFIHPDYKNRTDIKNVKRFQDTKLSQEQFWELKEEVERQGMLTMCTAFDEKSVQRIQEQGYQIIKIASCSFTDWMLLEEIAKTNLPVIASAAGSSIEDIDKVVSFFKHRQIPLALMHCIAEYPTPDEHLQMNQIDFYKNRYPYLTIGFSTHESPDDTEPVKLAVAKGAKIFEKHVGVPTDTITLNAYSANSQQVKKWLEAALKAYRMCGVENCRYESSEKEKSDLQALQRGVFVSHDINAGEKLGRDDYYLAFPSQPGQLLANQLSKYISVSLKNKSLKANDAVCLNDVEIQDNSSLIKETVLKIMPLLKKSNAVVPHNSTCQISHHYGIENYEQTGVAIIDCINREYCKKILILLPGQQHPAHLHKKKEETFTVLYGSLDLVCGGEKKTVRQGESMTIERGMLHSFSSSDGCVFEEISTTHYTDDSYYEQKDSFVNPRKTTVYLLRDMLEAK